jgi:hypothetical protein
MDLLSTDRGAGLPVGPTTMTTVRIVYCTTVHWYRSMRSHMCVLLRVRTQVPGSACHIGILPSWQTHWASMHMRVNNRSVLWAWILILSGSGRCGVRIQTREVPCSDTGFTFTISNTRCDWEEWWLYNYNFGSFQHWRKLTSSLRNTSSVSI